MGTLACDLGCFPLDNGAYPPLSHSPGPLQGIRGLVEFGKLTPPSSSSALPPCNYLKAAPKCISGRTSYLRVRLAFHPYPQLIPAFCTRHGFGPPPRYYRGFNLAMGSSPGFGSNPDNTSRMLETRPPSLIPHPQTIPEGMIVGIGSADSGLVSARLAPCSDSLSLRLRNFYSLT